VGATAVRGASSGRSERGRNEMVALVREVLRLTAVSSASCAGGNGRARPRQTDVRQAKVVASQSAAEVSFSGGRLAATWRYRLRKRLRQLQPHDGRLRQVIDNLYRQRGASGLHR
jgi:hypothetical protein